MKKIYIAPTLSVMLVREQLPVATSLKIDSSDHDGVSGDAKSDDWGNIWNDDETSFED